MRVLFYVAVLTVGLSVAAACGGDDETIPSTAAPAAPTAASAVTAVPPPAAIEPTTPPATDEPAAPSTGLIRVTSVNQDPGGSGEYTFNPDEFTFNVGDVVEFTLISETEFHTFTVDDLGIDVAMDGGSTQTLTHTFDKPGEFELICIPHELQGMVGSITVLP